jgi:hypothetical protein
MKKFFIVLIGFWLSTQNVLAQEVLSFKDWKKTKVGEVQTQIVQFESLQKTNSSRFGPEEQSKLKQAKTNLEIAQDLNAQDYFILYLSPHFQNDQQAYAKAAQMMSSEEIAQILIGYDKLIEERKKKNLIPIDSMKFGFSTPKKLDPEIVISSIAK